MNSKIHLDEMQRQKHDSVGNQMFMVMFWVLALNIILHAAGITWLPYPANIMAIMVVCKVIYRIRTRAYLPERLQGIKGKPLLIRAITFLVAFGIMAVLHYRQTTMEISIFADNPAMVLTLVAVIGLLALSVAGALVKKASRADDESEQD
jgi:hypothetical protein